MHHLERSFRIFVQSILFFFRGIFKFLGRLFFLDLWRNATARPVLLYAAFMIVLGTLLFHWLEQWSYLDSLYFIIITVTTIGFGDLSPTTPLSKVLTIFFGINGIVLLLVFFDLIRQVRGMEAVNMAEKMAHSDLPRVQKLGEDAKESLAKPTPKPPAWVELSQRFPLFHLIKGTLTRLFLIDLLKDTHSRGVLVYAGVTIVIGAIAFQQVEGWSFLNSIYFMVITMTTIGYGDITPALPWGKILTIFFGLNGIVVLLSLYDRIRAVRGQDQLLSK